MKLRFLKESLAMFFHSIKVGCQLTNSYFRLSRLSKPIVTVFGGAQADRSGDFAKKAHDFAQRLAQNGISVVTGGGPGIMVAANCGAAKVRKKGQSEQTLAISVSDLNDEFDNPCADTLYVNYFFMRKWLLIRYSVGFVVFPGGIGTMDDLFDLLNMLKCHRVPPLPVVLIGIAYWQPLVDWFKDSALKAGLVDERLTELFVVTDDMDQAYELIHEVCDLYLDDE